MINSFIDSCSSLENHTRFQTEMSKIYTRFQAKRRQKPTLWGGTYLYGSYKGVPPGLILDTRLLLKGNQKGKVRINATGMFNTTYGCGLL